MHLRPILSLGTAVLLLAQAGADAADATRSATTTDALTALFDDPVVARGEGFEIKRSEIDQAFIALKAKLAMRRQTIPEALRQLREAQLLEQLILNKLLNRRATEEDQKRSKEIAQRLVEEDQREFTSPDAFERRIKALGLSPAEFHRRIEEQALATAVIDRELKSKIIVPDTQVREFFDSGTDVLVRVRQDAVLKMASAPDTTLSQLANAKEQIETLRKSNLARLEQPELVRVQHIFARTKDRNAEQDLPEAQARAKRQKMDRLLARARNGEDFAKLVLENSEEQALEKTKGEWTLTRNDPFAPEFKAAAFSLRTNQVSDVVVTPSGLHIIKLLERTPAKKMDFEKAAPEIKDFLLQQEVQKALPDYFTRVQQAAAVNILDPKYMVEVPGAPDVNRPK